MEEFRSIYLEKSTWGAIIKYQDPGMGKWEGVGVFGVWVGVQKYDFDYKAYFLKEGMREAVQKTQRIIMTWMTYGKICLKWFLTIFCVIEMTIHRNLLGYFLQTLLPFLLLGFVAWLFADSHFENIAFKITVILYAFWLCYSM